MKVELIPLLFGPAGRVGGGSPSGQRYFPKRTMARDFAPNSFPISGAQKIATNRDLIARLMLR